MESTRIPKSFLKPPTKVARPEINSRLLPTISEIKASGTTTSNNEMIKHSALVSKVQQRGLLRRRSKSASDLRSIQPKPVITIGKSTTAKAAPIKSGQKRPALQKNDDENKPKVARVKIPDWDYKSRFQELQKRHTAMVEELKQLKQKVSNLPQLEHEAETLRNEKQSNVKKIEVFENNEKCLQDRLDTFSKENSTCKMEIVKLNNQYQSLKDCYDSLQEEKKIMIETEKNLKERTENLFDENSTLKTTLSDRENAYHHLQEAFKRLEELNKEYLQKITSCEKSLHESALNNTDLQKQCTELQDLTKRLKQDLEEHDNLRRSLHNTIQDMKGNIRVFCRVRPPVTTEENDRQLCSIFFPSDSNLEIRKSRESVSVISGKALDLKQEFTFDKVFPPETDQTEVFDELAQLIQSALDGYHVCVFAYGQTGSGKTFTMQGSPENQGMIPRTVDLIFQKIDKLLTTDWTYTVSASFLEIYNENIRDLLVPNSTHNYEVRYNEGRGVTVTNLQIVPIGSAEELRNLMEEAHKNRAVAATDFNEHSSRSHAVTKIHLEGYNKTTKAKYSGSLNLVDLAGSESAKTSSAERLNETKNINKSLSTLGNVMLALHNKVPHIPYRNSKLTFLLQSCLGGNSKTLMFVNISPFEECFLESINSLRFASQVKEIKTVAKKNKTYCSAPVLPLK